MNSELDVVNEVGNVIEEPADSKAEISRLKRIIDQMEVELKANRGTISRLASEAEKQHQSAMNDLANVRNFIREKEIFDAEKKETMNELEKMKINLAEKNSKLVECELKLKNFEKEIQMYGAYDQEIMKLKTMHTKFKNEIANVLFEGTDHNNDDDDIFFIEITNLKEEVKLMLKEKEIMKSGHKSVTLNEIQNLEAAVKNLETDLIGCRESVLKLERENKKYAEFISQLKINIGMSDPDLDLGLDKTIEAIMLRTNQLSRNETTSLAEKKSQVYTLQRKLKTLTENMDSKNLHLDLLRKKVASLENEKINKSDFEKEKDEACLKVKKMMKLLENYKKEMARLSLENKNLKDRLASTLDLANNKEEQQSTLEQLKTQSFDLENVCKMLHNNVAVLKNENKQLATKVEMLEKEFNTKETQIQELTDVKSQHISMLKNLSLLLTKECSNVGNNFSRDINNVPLTANKNRDDDEISIASGRNSTRSSSSCSNRRNSLALKNIAKNPISKTRHGVNTINNSDSLTEQEIYSTIESLIKSNKQNAATAYALDAAILDMADGFRSGFRKAAKTVEIEDVDIVNKMTTFDKTLRSVIVEKR